MQEEVHPTEVHILADPQRFKEDTRLLKGSQVFVARDGERVLLVVADFDAGHGHHVRLTPTAAESVAAELARVAAEVR